METKTISKEIGHALVRDHLIKYDLHETLAAFDQENRHSISVFEQDLLPLVMIDPTITKQSEEEKQQQKKRSLVIQALYTNQTMTNKLKKYKTHVKWQQNKLEDSHKYLTEMTKKYEKSINQCMKLQEEMKQKQQQIEQIQRDQHVEQNKGSIKAAYGGSSSEDQNTTEKILRLERENLQRKSQLKQMIEIQKQQQFKSEEAMNSASGQIKTLQRTVQEQNKEKQQAKEILMDLEEKVKTCEEEVQEKQQTIQQLQQELKSRNHAYKQLSSRIESIDQYKETNHELEKKIVELQVTVSGLHNEVQSKDDHIGMLKKEKRSFLKQSDKQEDSMFEKKKQIEHQMQTINELQADINQLMQTCNELKRRVKQHKENASSFQQQHRQVQQKLEKTQEQVQPMQERLKSFQLENHNLKKRIILMEQQSKLMKKHYETTHKVNTQYHQEKYKKAMQQQESLIKDLDIQNHQIQRESNLVKRQARATATLTPKRKLSSPQSPAQHELSEISQHLNALKAAMVKEQQYDTPQTPSRQTSTPSTVPSHRSFQSPNNHHVSFQLSPQQEYPQKNSPNKGLQDDLDANIRSLLNICETLKKTEQELR